MINIEKYWNAVITQNEVEMKTFLADNAIINWHCTNEQFTADEFIKANCKYPGKWNGEIEKTIIVDDSTVVTVVKVYNEKISCHSVSFINHCNDRIVSIDEYWGDDGEAPNWRKAMNIGKTIK